MILPVIAGLGLLLAGNPFKGKPKQKAHGPKNASNITMSAKIVAEEAESCGVASAKDIGRDYLGDILRSVRKYSGARGIIASPTPQEWKLILAKADEINGKAKRKNPKSKRKNPERTHIDHAAYAAKVRTMTDAALHYTMRDAAAALKAHPEGHKAGYYADEINYCGSELHRRRTKKNPTVGKSFARSMAKGSKAHEKIVRVGVAKGWPKNLEKRSAKVRHMAGQMIEHAYRRFKKNPSIDRDEAIARIKAGLKKRSGKSWSVRGGRGTAWGWITISAPPARCNEYGEMTQADKIALGSLLGLGRPAHHQGESVAADSNYRQEYIDRAEGREPSVVGTPYWD